jgi:hypothetical protein
VKLLSGKAPIEHVVYYDGRLGTSETFQLEQDPGCPNHTGAVLSEH